MDYTGAVKIIYDNNEGSNKSFGITFMLSFILKKKTKKKQLNDTNLSIQ